MSNERGHSQRRLAVLTKFSKVNDGSPKDDDVSQRRLLREWPG